MSGTLAIRDESTGPYEGLVEAFGFLPNLFQAQLVLPRVVEAEQYLIGAILGGKGPLLRPEKDRLLRQVAALRKDRYCQALHTRRAHESKSESTLLRFVLKLAKYTAWVSRQDIDALCASGVDHSTILDVVLSVALGQMLCTLALALSPELDPQLTSTPIAEFTELSDVPKWHETRGPYLVAEPLPTRDLPQYLFFREQFGFVPNLYRDQVLRPDAVQAEIQALERILLPEDHLSRPQKENILLVISAANRNAYCVAVHTQVLSALGVPPEVSDQVVDDYHQAGLSSSDVNLLDEIRRLAMDTDPSESRLDPRALQSFGFSEAQIVEAVAMAAFVNFMNILQAGIGAVPDFAPRRTFQPKDLYLSASLIRPTSEATAEDADAPLVARVQSGDSDAFEELVRRHTRRIFAILAGLLGNPDDARDATQDAFLKAYEHIGRFQGRSKFSTWLASIAINTGTELLRQRRPSQPLEECEENESFRPRQLQSWADNPEQLLARAQCTDLVREGVLRLPQKYRLAILLRDINQVSTEDAAAALGLSIPALKARVLRGRLMLREILTPHFVRTEKRSADA
jgi:RNA polymerase sigma-70 factor (ECF subfamily)